METVGRPIFAGVMVTGLLSLVACSGESTTAASPTKICGHTLYAGAMGMFLYNVWTSNKDVPPMPTRLAPIPAGKTLPALLLRVAPTCGSGAVLRITPTTGLVVAGTVSGRDGRPVAVAVQGGAPGPVTLSVRLGAKTRQLRLSVGSR